MIYIKKKAWKYDIFFKCSEKMVFRVALEYDLAYIIRKDGISFSQKYIFLPMEKER